MSKEILVNVGPHEKRVAVVNDGRLEEFYIERPQDRTIVGNIYKGVIEAALPSIGAAFVDIGLPKKGFLYLSEIEGESDTSGRLKSKHTDVKKGQEVLVQVVKEGFGTKGPRLSCEIGIAGRFIVLMPNDQQIGVSRRIEDDEERKRLKHMLQELKLPKDAGFIVRTVAAGKSKQELYRDARFLLKLWERLKKIINKQKAPSLVYEEYDLVLRAIRDSFTEDVTKLIIDSKPEYYRIHRFMRTFAGNLSRRLELHRGEDLFADKDIEKQINKIFESKIYLKSKAYIIIEPTEGLVVVDVNSGGFRKNLGQEEAAFKVNCDAAIEAAHQLVLRDLGGIIVIDFIDMEKEAHRREVFNILKKELSKDKAKYDILGISKFGLVEMTRERIHKTVDTLSFQACPYCQGKGKVKSPVTMAIYVIKELKKFLHGKSLKEVSLIINPLVLDEIMKDPQNFKFIERKYRIKINPMPNPALHIEDIKIS